MVLDLTSEAVIHGPAVRPRISLVDRVSAIITIVVIFAAVLVVTHVALRIADQYPYISVDDSLANISAAFSNIGVYGHPALPVQGRPEDQTLRLSGFFLYGPWPFYAGAALDWVFGTSYAIQRFLHPLCLMGVVVAFGFAFRRDNLGLTSIFAWLLFGIFWNNMWPMVRPDPFVALFVGAAIGSFTLALLRDSRGAWLAGSFFACSAFLTHQIAWAVVPWTLLLIGLGVGLRRMDNSADKNFRRFLIHRVLAVSLGAAVSTAIYLEAIDFRLDDVILQMRRYATGWGSINPQPFSEIFSRHFEWTWASVSPNVLVGVAAGIGLGLAAVLASFFLDRRDRRAVVAFVVPPTLIAGLYALSVGFYPNFTSGYVLVSYVAAGWAAIAGYGAVILILARLLPAIAPLMRLATTFIGLYLLAAQSVAILQSGPAWAAGDRYIPFSRYYDEVLDHIPKGATVTGGAIFALESGIRHALVQWGESVDAWRAMAPDARAVYVPDFAVMNDMLRYIVLDAVREKPNTQVPELFAGHVFELYQITYAYPYGTTRVYKSYPTNREEKLFPIVSVFGAEEQAWASSLEEAHLDALEPVEPVQFSLKSYNASGAAQLSKKLTIAEGEYLLELETTSGLRGEGIFVATDTDRFVSNLGVNLNFELFEAPYWPHEESVFLLVKHEGGDLYLSHLTLEGREHFDFRIKKGWRVGGLDIPSIQAPVPPLEKWIATAGDAGKPESDGSVIVSGDNSTWGFQFESPAISTPRNIKMKLRVNLDELSGNVAVGVLDAQKNWLPGAAAVDKHRELIFDTGTSGEAYVVFANLNQNISGTPDKTAFKLLQVELSILPEPIDRIRAWFHCHAAPASEQNDPVGPCQSEAAARDLLMQTLEE